MGKRRSRPVITATVSKNNFDWLAEMKLKGTFCQSTYIDNLITADRKKRGKS